MERLDGDAIANILRGIADKVEGVSADRIVADMDFDREVMDDGVDERGYVKARATGGRYYRIEIRLLAPGKRVAALSQSGNSYIEGHEE